MYYFNYDILIISFIYRHYKYPIITYFRLLISSGSPIPRVNQAALDWWMFLSLPEQSLQCRMLVKVSLILPAISNRYVTHSLVRFCM